jgi:protein O-GlcNAc transferase
MQPPNATTQALLARAFAAHQAGDIATAEQFYRLVLQADKRQFDALHMLGVIEAQRGNFAGGMQRLNDALRARPNSAEALVNLGRMKSELGQDGEAVATYQKALALNPRSALAHNNLGIVLRRLRRGDEALTHCDAALAAARDYPDAWNNRGNVLYDLNRPTEALESYDRALQLQPALAESHLGRGNVLHKLRRAGEALAAYDRAIAIRADRAEHHFGRGNALQQLRRPDEALAAYDRAIAIDPNFADAWYGRGVAASHLGLLAEQYEAFAKACALKPDLPNAEGGRLYAKLQACDWDKLEAECTHLEAAIGQGEARAEPFVLFASSASPAIQRQCAELYAAARYPASAEPLWRGERYGHARIRLAYISADFRNHPVSYLTAGLFEAHDRTRFETTAVSTAPATEDEMRVRMCGAFERFVDAAERSDRDIAELLRELEIDIAVDLTGFTGSSRAAVFARRPVPVQATYLGYPGTMGTSYFDYIIADRTIVPPEHAAFYTEKIAMLPDSYQANDRSRAVAQRLPTRAELQLPEAGFVFCCFNNSYKLGPAPFAIWMRLLAATADSVLWLSDVNGLAKANLRREAERAGVAPERLIFAPRMAEMADHLARHRQADLFLDTLPFNAHTTASDALWAGLPVLTCLGSTLAGRVAASLVRAVGMPELVTASLADYEALALKIAGDPAFCAALKDKLRRNRETAPLFDTLRFTRNIEAAYTTMQQRSQRRAPPESFAVEAAPVG